MKIIQSSLFQKFPEIALGISTRTFENPDDPFGLNMSITVDSNSGRVIANRKKFFEFLGFDYASIATQRQIHSDIIKVVNSGGSFGESDALITSKENIGLAISIADCTPIFLYDKQSKIIAGVHSGWRGTEKEILRKVISKLKNEFNSDPKNIFAFIGPAISQRNYEIGNEVAEKFDRKYITEIGNSKFLDVSGINFDILLEEGIEYQNIELSNLCTFENEFLHSYRRDGNSSGRALGIIAIRNN